MEQYSYYDKLIDQTPDVFCILRGQGQIIYCGSSSRKLLGYDPEAIVGRNALRYLHPAERHQARLRHSVLLAYPGNRVTADYRVLDAHGEYRWMECIFNNMLNLPQIDGILVQLRDVTDRKNFELQLEESEERFRIFMNNAPTVSMIKDEEGRLVFVNANFERSFRVLSKDALGMTLGELFPNGYWAESEENDRIVLNFGKSVEFFERTITPDGVEREWIVYKFPVPQSNGKTFIGCSAMDITKWSSLDRERVTAEQKFKTIFEYSPDPIFIENEDGIIIDANRKACELQGMNYPELVGKRITDLAPPDHHEELWSDFSKLWNGQLSRIDSYSWSTSGQVIPVAISTARIQHMDQPCLLLALRER